MSDIDPNTLNPATCAASTGAMPKLYSRHNYWVFIFEGGFFMGGIAFLAADSVLPAMVKELGGPDWMLAFLPSLMWIGILLPSFFVNHIVERRSEMKPFVMFWSGIQKLIFLPAALLLFVFAETWPLFALAVILGVQFTSGLMGGVSLSAWATLVARTVPANRRSGAAAIKNLVGAVIGIGAGFAIDAILSRFPGVTGYAWLHLSCFAMMFISLILYGQTREPKVLLSPNPATASFGTMVRSFPELLRRRPAFTRFVLSRMFGAAFFLVVPFMAVRAIELTGRGPELVGMLVSAQMVGGVLGNIFAGITGDRLGGKAVTTICFALFLIHLALFVVASGTVSFLLVFGLWGFVHQAKMVGDSTLSMELSQGPRMASYMTMSNTGFLLSLLGFAFLASFLRVASSGIGLLVGVSAAFALAGLTTMLSIKEPRQLRVESGS